MGPRASQYAQAGSFGEAVVQLICTELQLHMPSTLFSQHGNLDGGLLDLAAVMQKDPALAGQPPSVPFLFFKGFKAIQAYRMSHLLWNASDDVSRFEALAIQSRCSEVWAVDIHPAATIGRSFLLDHATGIVIGETAVVGNNVVMLHGVTLGGKGGQHGVRDRHPKLGDNITVGCNASILGNLVIGSGTTIGSGAVVTKSFPGVFPPGGQILVGSPAKALPPPPPPPPPQSKL